MCSSNNYSGISFTAEEISIYRNSSKISVHFILLVWIRANNSQGLDPRVSVNEVPLCMHLFAFLVGLIIYMVENCHVSQTWMLSVGIL